MSPLRPQPLIANIKQATNASDRNVDIFVNYALQNIDISTEPWVSRLDAMRKDMQASAEKKAR